MYANTVPNLFYNWIISLPMMVSFFGAIFFIVRFHRGNDEQMKYSVNGNTLHLIRDYGTEYAFEQEFYKQ